MLAPPLLIVARSWRLQPRFTRGAIGIALPFFWRSASRSRASSSRAFSRRCCRSSCPASSSPRCRATASRYARVTQREDRFRRAESIHLHRPVPDRARDVDAPDPAHADLQRDDVVPLRVRRDFDRDVRHDRGRACWPTCCARGSGPGRSSTYLAVAAVTYPIAIVLSFLTQLSVPFLVHPSVVAAYAIVFTVVVISVPFVVSGICVSLTLTQFAERVSALYAADLAGAALGCLLVLGLLRVTDAADGRGGAWPRSPGVGGDRVRAGTRGRRRLLITAVGVTRGARRRRGRAHRVRLAPVSDPADPLHQGAARSAAAVREVEFLFARARQRRHDGRARSALRVGAELHLAAGPAGAPAQDGHRRQRRHGDDRVSAATRPRSST